MPDEQEAPYNPLAISSIAESVVRELFSRACCPLTSLTRFGAAGVYALYYRGDFAEAVCFPEYWFYRPTASSRGCAS